jgi:glycine cleavage system H protein
MNAPENLKFTKNHEWIRLESDDTAYVGITDFAQKELGDIVFVEIETEGEELDKESPFGTIEAVKTVADVFVPVSGKVIEVNPKLADNPEIVNKSPYEDGWLIKIQVADTSELDDLMDAKQYSEMTE